MTNVPAAVPPPRQGHVWPPRSAPASQGLPVVPVLRASESAVLYPPPPVGPRCQLTSPTSGTQATPAATLQPVLELVPSLSTRPLMMSVNSGKS